MKKLLYIVSLVVLPVTSVFSHENHDSTPLEECSNSVTQAIKNMIHKNPELNRKQAPRVGEATVEMQNRMIEGCYSIQEIIDEIKGSKK